MYHRLRLTRDFSIYSRHRHSGQEAATIPSMTSLWRSSQEKPYRSSNSPASHFSSGHQMRGSPLSQTPPASCTPTCWSTEKASSPTVTTSSSFSSCLGSTVIPAQCCQHLHFPFPHAPGFLSLLLGLYFSRILSSTSVCNSVKKKALICHFQF